MHVVGTRGGVLVEHSSPTSFMAFGAWETLLALLPHAGASSRAEKTRTRIRRAAPRTRGAHQPPDQRVPVRTAAGLQFGFFALAARQRRLNLDGDRTTRFSFQL